MFAGSTHLGIHASIAKVIVVYPFLAFLRADSDIAAVDVGEASARRTLEFGIDVGDFLICHVN